MSISQRKIDIADVVKWVEKILRRLPPKSRVREGRWLWSKFVGWCLLTAVDIRHLEKLGLKSFKDFLKLLDEHFINKDGLYYLRGEK
jgi:hypothetical protein